MLTFLLLAQLAAVTQQESIQFYTRVSPDTVYVGQQATYDAVVLVPHTLIPRMAANPIYLPSEIRGASIYEFLFDSTRLDDIDLRGTRYKRIVFRRGVFPLSAGTLQIAPATMTYSLTETRNGRSQSVDRSLESESVLLVVVPLPGRGRPLEFSGAVGQFTDTAFIDNANPQVGEPIILTLRVLGAGDINHLPRPLLSLEWASVIENEERVLWDSTGSFVRGYKEFEWILTPTVVGELFIPSIRFEYFDPGIKSYSAATTRPISVQVQPKGETGVDSFRPNYDSVQTTPLPGLWKFLTDYWLIPLIAGAALLFLVVFLKVRGAGHHHTGAGRGDSKRRRDIED